MSRQEEPRSERRSSSGRTVDARQLWSGGAGLATVIAVVYPFSTTAPLSQKAATAVINLVLGAAIGSLINGTAARVIRRRATAGGYQPSYPSPAPGN